MILLQLITLVAAFVSLSLSSEDSADDSFCPLDRDGALSDCRRQTPLLAKFLFYDVNPPEGFNLRRDVFMRLAIFMHNFHKKNGDWHLVLPPWHHLAHWRSMDIGEQFHLQWSLFFDVESIKRFAPVIELQQYFDDLKTKIIDKSYVLQFYKEAFSSPNWQWVDKWEIQDCTKDLSRIYVKTRNGNYGGWFWGYNTLRISAVDCVSFQGPASLLGELLNHDTSSRSIMIDHAEIPLHERFGGKTYWECRRSMRFAKHLHEEAAQFRRLYLNSTNEQDKTVLPERWEDENNNRSAIGGPYLSIHLRRRDFLVGRAKEVPSLEYGSRQISLKLLALGINTVFISTDATEQEFQKLKRLLTDFKVFRYVPSRDSLVKFKDGGVSIVDQIICSHARYFMGTHESTFSFRIQEEREILGFPVETTFNRLCGEEPSCSQPTKWTIVR